VPSSAKGYAVSSTAKAHAVSSPAKAYTTSGTANGSVAISPGSRSPIPLPDHALLSQQSEPACEFKATEAKTDERDQGRQSYRAERIVVGQMVCRSSP
jgi:hypothetical protein